ncbi:hypothetical protein [Pedobacter psychroterrae]|nr:hypothetical protein [Pedobacter psychroterrae]
MEQDKQPGQPEKQELPPFVKTWKQFYALLIGWLVLLVLLFYAFTKYFE